jgi:phosphoglycolate phosphatase
MAQKLILFDIDKTLIKDMKREGNPWIEAFESVYGIKNKIKMSKESFHGMTHRQIAIELLKMRGLKEEEILGKLDEFMVIFGKAYEKSLKNGRVVLFPKIPDLLQKLSEKHILELITGNIKKVAFIKLKLGGIDRFFSTGGFGDDSSNREDLVRLALERANEKYGFTSDGRNTFIIGDTPNDILAAKKFSLKTIGVATGIYPKSQLEKCGADFVLDNLEDIEAVTSIIEGKP